jgi:hypothetical protein
MISLKNATSKIIRETTAEIEFVGDAGETKKEQTRVQYYDRTTKQLKESHAAIMAKAAADPDALVWESESLFERLAGLPDIIDEETKKPVEITLDFIESLSVKNLMSIQEAIKADLNPKKSTPDSPPAG